MTPCARILLDALVIAGTWCTRAKLDQAARAAGFGEGWVDDEIVYLVTAGAIEFSDRTLMYRVRTGSTLARQAAARLAQAAPEQRVQLLGRPAADGQAGDFELGIALRCADSQGQPMTVTARIDVPCGPGPDGMAVLAAGLATWGRRVDELVDTTAPTAEPAQEATP